MGEKDPPLLGIRMGGGVIPFLCRNRGECGGEGPGAEIEGNAGRGGVVLLLSKLRRTRQEEGPHRLLAWNSGETNVEEGW